MVSLEIKGYTKDLNDIPNGVLSSYDMTNDVESWFIGFNSLNLSDNNVLTDITIDQETNVSPPDIYVGVMQTNSNTASNCVFCRRCSSFTLDVSTSTFDKPTTDGAVGLLIDGKIYNITDYCKKDGTTDWNYHFEKLLIPPSLAGKEYRLVIPYKYGSELCYASSGPGWFHNPRGSVITFELTNTFFGSASVDKRVILLEGVPSGGGIYMNYPALLTVITEKNLLNPPFKKTVDGTAIYLSNATFEGKPCVTTTRVIDGVRKVAHVIPPVYWRYSKTTDTVNTIEISGSSTFNLDNTPWGPDKVYVKVYDGSSVVSSDYFQYQFRVDEEYSFVNPYPIGTKNKYSDSYDLGDEVIRRYTDNLSERWGAEIFLDDTKSIKIYQKNYVGVVSYNTVISGDISEKHRDQYISGKAYTIRVLPQEVGYTFSGWYPSDSASSNTYAPNATYVLTAYNNDETISLYAIAAADTYIINIDWDGGTSDSNTSSIAYKGTRFSPPTASKDGQFVGGYYVSGTSTKFAEADGTLVSNIPGYTNGLGQYIATSGISLYASWAFGDMDVIFDPNGGEFKSDPPRRTVNGRVSPIPSVSRRGYIFKGWRPRKLIDEAGTPQYFAEKISTDTIFSSTWCVWPSEDGVSNYVNMQATWAALDVDENYPNSYLEVSYKDDDGNIIDHIVKLPQVVSIDDVITSSLVEKETILYGYKNRFVMDIGTKRTFAVTMVRVNPIDYDDNVTPDYDESKMSNNMWWSQFISLIDRWQNYMVSSDGVRTGGMRFVYEPPSVDGLNELYPVIDKNVFITGQITMSSTPSLLKMTIPMTVASMSASESVQRWKVRFYMYKAEKESDQESVPYFETSAPMGFMMTIPAPMSEWSNAYSASTTPKSFSKWVDGAGKSLRPNEELPMPQNYTDSTCPIYYATWADISAICIYTVTGELNANRTYTYTADSNCIISAILYGGGGTGGSFYMESINFGTNFRYYAGGGGGASAPTSVSFTVSQGEKVKIDVGLGGNSYPNCDINDSGGVLLSGVRNGTPTKLTHGYAEYESKYGAAGTNKQKGGSFNGGDGGEPHSDGNKGRGANESSGGMQRTIAEGWGITTEYHGGGGGGGSITLVRANEKVTYNDKEYRPSYVYKGANVYLNGDSIGANGTVYILSKGGDGQTHGVDNSDNTTCDAMNGTDVSGSERFIFCSAGGGGRAGAILKRSKGADGVAILYITKVGDSQ